jgi:hypothetical protein
MMPPFTIVFNFHVPEGPDLVLRAIVEPLLKNMYRIKEVYPVNRRTNALVPPVQVKQIKGCWVHTDSGKQTALSTAIGFAIEHGPMELAIG